MEPKVSIITASYNSEKYIKDAITSVISQSYSNIEYIIIDGESKDDTVNIAKSFGSKISKIISEPDKGIYDAMNKGIRIASGDIVGILNSDDFYVNSEVIKKIVDKIKESNVDICWADLVYVDQNDTDKVIRTWKSSEYKDGKFKNGWHPPHPTFFVKKSIYEKYGVFNLDFKISADYEIMLRFLEKNHISSAYIPEVIIKMRTGGVSNKSIKNIISANIESFRAWKINGLKIFPLRILLKPLRKLIQYV